MPAKRELSSSQLIELYQGRKLPIRTIAGILGCGASTVESHLRALSVTLRSKSEALTGKRYVDLPEGELSDLYLNKRLSSRALAERYSVSARPSLNAFELWGSAARVNGQIYLGKR